jgi:hypothetical protein
MGLKTILQTLLNDNSPNLYQYTISYENISNTQDTGKLTFSVSGNSGNQPQFSFVDGMYEQLGFESNTTYNFNSDSLTSVNIINLNPEATLFIRSNICQNSQDNILQNIITPLNSSFSYIVFENKCPKEYSKIFNVNGSNVFEFTITNEAGEIIDFNGLNVVFTLMLYKRDRTSELHSDFIKMKTMSKMNVD